MTPRLTADKDKTPQALPESPAWHALTAAEALDQLKSSQDGLSVQETQARLERYGLNVIEQDRGPSAVRLLLRQFKSPIVYLLLGATILAAALGKPVDALVVLGAIIVNVIIGFIQEYQASKAVQALSRMVPQEAVVVRGARRETIPAARVVPGDVVLLGSGDRIPADLRLMGSRGLQVEEAALTGESVPVLKSTHHIPADAGVGDRLNMAYGGTVVTAGSGTGVVVATGGATELGRISRMLQEATELQTPLTRALATLGTWLTLGVIGVSLLLLAVSMLRGYSLGYALFTTVTLAVATIPEGLPAILTITMAVGVQRMARRNAIIRTLPSVETLGSTTVICSDKTGTLTRNEMTVQELWTPAGSAQVEGVGYIPRGHIQLTSNTQDASAQLHPLLRASALCNDASIHQEGDAWKMSGDPTEAALVVVAEKGGVQVSNLRRQWPRIDHIPFESEQQFMATMHRDPSGGTAIHVKGAPEAVLPRCELPKGLTCEGVLHQVNAMASRGLRVLAVAESIHPDARTDLSVEDVKNGLTLLGLVGMMDPPRPEAMDAVKTCHAAGITVKMITGDHRRTAEAIGTQMGLLAPGDAVLEGHEIGPMDDAQLVESAQQVNVFARVAPEHKLRLVRALQTRGHVVAMTGDGVNDAPALKQADIGVAMGITGTAVSREAADMVLADDNFATITAAVQEGRRIYDNIIKCLAFVIPTNLGLGLVMVAAVLFFPVVVLDGTTVPLLPVLPTQLLWVNLVASVALSVPLAFEVAEPDVMRKPPRHPDDPILGPFLLARAFLAALLMSAGAVGLFLWEYNRDVATLGYNQAVREAQTMAVTTIVFYQVFYLLNCRSLLDSVFKIGFFSNPVVFGCVAVLLLLHALFVYLPVMNSVFGTAPLAWDAVALAALVGAVVLPVITVEKAIRSRARDRRNGRALAVRNAGAEDPQRAPPPGSLLQRGTR